MFILTNYKPRKLILEINDLIECVAVERIRFNEEKLTEIIKEYTKKYNSPRYDFGVIEILDLDWEEDK